MLTVIRTLVQLLLAGVILIVLGWAAPPKWADCLDNGLARTPPMGWINWARFMCQTDCEKYPDDCVGERLFRSMIDRVASDGYLEAGYQYVNIDDCWSELARDDTTHSLVADRHRFPAGIESLAKYAHDRRVKLGIYGDCGTRTCAGYPAQLRTEQKSDPNYFQTDAQSLASWEIDSFKFDGCHLDPSKAESICPGMAAALNATKRPILTVCEWPFYMKRLSLEPNYQLARQSCNAWRYYEDVEDSWASVMGIVDFTIKIQEQIVEHHGPGHWFDPDQLVVGNFGLSLEQARAQMALWSIWSAPLYMSNDLRHMAVEMAAVLKNKQLIAVDQDRLGVFGVMVNQSDGNQFQAFVKPIEPIRNGCPSFAIVYLNRHTLGNKSKISFSLRRLLHHSALTKAAQRYSELVGANRRQESPFSAEECRKRLLNGMTREPTPADLLVTRSDIIPIEEQTIVYRAEDLFGDRLEFSEIRLNEDLRLEVNPSGVRAVRLIEASA